MARGEMTVWALLPLALAVLQPAAGQCNRRYFEYDSFVCVCDDVFCDEPGLTDVPVTGSYSVYTSTRDLDRLALSRGDLATTPDLAAVSVIINSTHPKNQILGFGGAFTDSTGINIAALPQAAQENLLRAYFAPEGIEYDLCRVPIAGSDCSTRPYSYCDVEGDVELVNFALQPEDYNFKLPLIRRALELSPGEIFIFGSPWSPPAWMKTNGMFNGTGQLLPEMWQPWSNYFVKFVEAYEEEGVRLWGLTTQNEPETGIDLDNAWNTCGWYPEDMRDWIKGSLGPSLEEAGLRRLKLMVMDSTRGTLPDFPEPMLVDPESNKYIDGVAVHWYMDQTIGPEVNLQTQDLDRSKFLLYTEGCEGFDVEDDTSVSLGSWMRGEHYFEDIIENLNFLSSGWVDWNMALDLLGGPNWANNMLDAPIIVNKTSGEFYKQPTFYAMGHASKFIVRYGLCIDTSTDGGDLRVTSVLNPDGTIVLLLLNKAETAVNISVQVHPGKFLNAPVPAKSFQTYLIPSG